MDAANFSDVTLVSADLELLLCQEEQVKKGKGCSLLLETKNGFITTTFKVNKCKSPAVKVSTLVPTSKSQAEKKKKRGGKQRLEKLLAYHQRLVDEKGLPPSRLMLQHATDLASRPTPQPEQVPKQEEKI